MGRICIAHKKENWKILFKGKYKQNPNKIVCEVQVGEWDDYCGYGHISLWMLEDVYEKVVNGTYAYISQPYSEEAIIIKDKNGCTINPLKDLISS